MSDPQGERRRKLEEFKAKKQALKESQVANVGNLKRNPKANIVNSSKSLAKDSKAPIAKSKLSSSKSLNKPTHEKVKSGAGSEIPSEIGKGSSPSKQILDQDKQQATIKERSKAAKQLNLYSNGTILLDTGNEQTILKLPRVMLFSLENAVNAAEKGEIELARWIFKALSELDTTNFVENLQGAYRPARCFAKRLDFYSTWLNFEEKWENYINLCDIYTMASENLTNLAVHFD
jgi:hypothetical protein